MLITVLNKSALVDIQVTNLTKPFRLTPTTFNENDWMRRLTLALCLTLAPYASQCPKFARQVANSGINWAGNRLPISISQKELTQYPKALLQKAAATRTSTNSVKDIAALASIQFTVKRLKAPTLLFEWCHRIRTRCVSTTTLGFNLSAHTQNDTLLVVASLIVT